MNLHADERRLAFFDVFPCDGQLSVLHLYPGAISAWHRHQKQDNYFFCAQGAVRLGIRDDQHLWWATLDAHTPDVFFVKAGLRYGYQCLSNGATLLVWSSEKYNATAPDEERMPPGDEWTRQPH